MKYLRRLNKGVGVWSDWPLATASVRDRIRTSQIPKYTKPDGFEEQLSRNVPFSLIDTPARYAEMHQDLILEDVISLDYEFHKEHSYDGLIALVQIGTSRFNYKIDPFEVREEIMEDLVPNLLESNHVLKDEWKIEDPDDCFKTMKLAFKDHIIDTARCKKKIVHPKDITENRIREEWSKPNPVSYKKLVESLFRKNGIKLDKTGQAADFRKYPSDETLIATNVVRLSDPHHIRVFKSLLEWRDGLGRTMDEAPNNILDVKELERIAKASSSPLLWDGLVAMLHGNTCPFVVKQFRHILAIVNCDEVALRLMSQIV
ncbi:unnamed protein product [Allacma fusca]|nr:unnamed protein product [Allacma fusca]